MNVLDYSSSVSLPNSLQIFQDLLNYLKVIPDSNELLLNYKRNLLIFKDSQKVPQELPEFYEIELFWVREYAKDEIKHNKTNIPLGVNKKVFLIWLVAAFELLTQKSFNEFVQLIFLLKKLFLSGKQ